MLQLVDFIAKHYNWGSKQLITLWRDLEIESIEINSDEQLFEWCQLNLDKGVVQINAQVNDFEGLLRKEWWNRCGRTLKRDQGICIVCCKRSTP
jgi:hypothetical protein